MSAAVLPAGLHVLERGWLSSNNLLVAGDQQHGAALIDSGHLRHADLTVALVAQVLHGAPLETIAHTHLHSDHAGGTAALQRQHPEARTWVPAGSLRHVQNWDTQALGYAASGQQCARLRADRALQPGGRVRLGAHSWEIHAAPGHDPDALLLFEPHARVLISGDALWGHGFGVVFPELTPSDDGAGFADVAATLDLIESLDARVVVPGHGAVFKDVAAALTRARERLAHWRAHPVSHALHAVRVLIVFHVMEVGPLGRGLLLDWMQLTPLLREVHAQRFASAGDLAAWSDQMMQHLLDKGALREHNGLIEAAR